MSRRDGRDSDSKRHRSRFDEEPSPKKSRRDAKPETERSTADTRDSSDQEQKQRRRLQDALPLETQLSQSSTVEVQDQSKESEKANANRDRTKDTPNPVPRSRSYFQHDDRGNAGQVGRRHSYRAAADRGWHRDPIERQSERGNRISASDVQKKDGRARIHGNDSTSWHHDRYFELEGDPKAPARKRPSFREKKIPDENEKADKAVEVPGKPVANEQTMLDTEKRHERGGQNSRHLDRPGSAFARERDAKRGEPWRGDYPSRDQFSSRNGGHYRERDQYTGRQGYHSTRGHDDKWKHDLFDEANKVPSPKNEDDVVAKIEALLA